MTPRQYRQQFTQDDAVGWQAIDRHLKGFYGAQEPRHHAPVLRWGLGGDSPLDGCSIYDHQGSGLAHRHLVSYGMSALYYDEDSAGGSFSGWGFEFTMRVPPFDGDPASAQGHAHEPLWAMPVMQNLARYVVNSGNGFEPYHFTTTNGPVRLDCDTRITALAFVPDLELGTLATPHGTVNFLQMVGLTQAEYDWLQAEPTTARTGALMARMRPHNPWLLTDLTRRASYA